MKCFSLLLCASALCISSTTGFHEGQLFFMDTVKEEHERHKRQGDFYEDSQCEMAIHDELCINGFAQGYAEFFQECDMIPHALATQAICTPNSMGGYCRGGTFSSLQRKIDRECNISSTTCSQECRTYSLLVAMS